MLSMSLPHYSDVIPLGSGSDIHAIASCRLLSATRLSNPSSSARAFHDEIIASWKAKAAWEGLDNLVAERQRLDAIAWISDPLPSGITSE